MGDAHCRRVQPFSRESVSVGQTGGAQMDLAGGGRIEVLRDSAVQLNRSAAGVQFLTKRSTIQMPSTFPKARQFAFR